MKITLSERKVVELQEGISLEGLLNGDIIIYRLLTRQPKELVDYVDEDILQTLHRDCGGNISVIQRRLKNYVVESLDHYNFVHIYSGIFSSLGIENEESKKWDYYNKLLMEAGI